MEVGWLAVGGAMGVLAASQAEMGPGAVMETQAAVQVGAVVEVRAADDRGAFEGAPLGAVAEVVVTAACLVVEAQLEAREASTVACWVVCRVEAVGR